MPHVPLSGRFRPAQIAFVCGVLLLVGASGASAATTLAGETLTAGNDRTGLDGTCNATGSSSFTYSTSGAATGPVVGTFSEDGSFTLASPTGPLTSFSSTFTIHATGQPDITGTKTLGTPLSASCLNTGFFSLAAFAATTHYQVSVPFSETGNAPLAFDATFGNTTFVEGPFATAPLAPTSKQDCMNGGFQNFIDPGTGAPFSNQGQCIKFVNHET